MQTTQVRHHVAAPRAEVFRALLDADAVARWRVPDGMSSVVHEFDPREGGTFRVTLTYDSADAAGKTSGNADTYHGRFVTIVPGETVVEQLQFETDDPALQGRMTLTTTLTDADDGGTDVVMEHQGLPDAVPAADNETGTRMALQSLARLVEGTVEGTAEGD